jgi:hypothetical protein
VRGESSPAVNNYGVFTMKSTILCALAAIMISSGLAIASPAEKIAEHRDQIASAKEKIREAEIRIHELKTDNDATVAEHIKEKERIAALREKINHKQIHIHLQKVKIENLKHR